MAPQQKPSLSIAVDQERKNSPSVYRREGRSDPTFVTHCFFLPLCFFFLFLFLSYSPLLFLSPRWICSIYQPDLFFLPMIISTIERGRMSTVLHSWL